MESSKPKYQSLEINLLPASAVSLTKLYRPFIVAGVSFFAILIVLFVISVIANANRQTAETEIAQIETEIIRYQQKIDQSNVLGSVAEYLNLPATLRTEQVDSQQALQNLESIVLDGMNIQSLEMTSGNRISMNASFASSELLISFMKKLKDDKMFQIVSYSGFNNVPASADANGQYSPITQVNFELQYNKTGKQGE